MNNHPQTKIVVEKRAEMSTSRFAWWRLIQTLVFVFGAGVITPEPLAQAQSSRSSSGSPGSRIQPFLSTLPPARTLTNRGRKAVRLTLSDRVSGLLLPPGWQITSRGFYHTENGARMGLFSHYLRPVRGRGGVLLTIIYGEGTDMRQVVDAVSARRLAAATAAGRNDALLLEAYRQFGGLPVGEIKRQEANKRIRDTTWGGLSGMMLSNRDGSALPSSRDELLNIRQGARYMVTVASANKIYSFADSTSGQSAAVRSIFASFKPG